MKGLDVALAFNLSAFVFGVEIRETQYVHVTETDEVFEVCGFQVYLACFAIVFSWGRQVKEEGK